MNLIQKFYLINERNNILHVIIRLPNLLTDFEVLLNYCNYIFEYLNVFQDPENQQNGATSTRIQGFTELKINNLFVFCYFVFYHSLC